MSRINDCFYFIQKIFHFMNNQNIDITKCPNVTGSIKCFFQCNWYPKFLKNIFKKYYQNDKDYSRAVKQHNIWKNCAVNTPIYSVGLKLLKINNNITENLKNSLEIQKLNLYWNNLFDIKMFEPATVLIEPSTVRNSQVKTERVIQFLLDHRKLSNYTLHPPQANKNHTVNKYSRLATIEINEDNVSLCSRHSRYTQINQTKNCSFKRNKSSRLKINRENCSIDKNILENTTVYHHKTLIEENYSRSASKATMKSNKQSLIDIKATIKPKKSKQKINNHSKTSIDHGKLHQYKTTNKTSSTMLFYDINNLIEQQRLDSNQAGSIDSGVEISKISAKDFDNSGENSSEEIDRALEKITNDLIQWEKRARARAKFKEMNFQLPSPILKLSQVNYPILL